MTGSTDLQRFLENIMRIHVTYLGGAAAGILGSTDANDDIVNSLKKSSLAFAQRYKSKECSQVELAAMADEITGYVQTLQVTNALSARTAEELIDQLDELLNEVSRS